MKLFFFLILLSQSVFSADCINCTKTKSAPSRIANDVICEEFKKLQNKFEKNDNRSVSVEERLKNIDSFHSFYRSFPNFFYHLLRSKEIKAELKNVIRKKYSGFISGDPHIENFGAFAFKENGKEVAKISMNDFDDSGKGAYVYDLIRYLGSLDIYRSEEDIELKNKKVEDLIDLYAEVINNNGHFEPQKETAKVLKKSLKDINENSKDIDYQTGKFIDKNQPKCIHSSSSDDVHLAFEALGFSKFSDCYRRIKNDGGSAGLPRQYYLVKNKKDYEVYEIKKLPRRPATAIKKISYNSAKYERHTKKVIELSLGKEFSENYYKNISYNKSSNALIKPHSEGFKKLRPNKKEDDGSFKLKKKKRWQVIVDQVKTLAKLHAKTLSNKHRKNYVKEINNIKWNKVLRMVTGRFKNYYKACK